MTKYTVTLYSKNKESLDNFFIFFKHSLKIQEIQKPINYTKKKKRKKKISVLTSPHVNKSAQEQFEYCVYSVKLVFYSYKTKKNLIMLKKIKNQLFPDIKIKITGENFLKNKQNPVKKIVLNPNNFTFNFINFNNIKQKLKFNKLKKNKIILKNQNLLKKTSSYLKLLNWYGAHSLDSSVGRAKD